MGSTAGSICAFEDKSFANIQTKPLGEKKNGKMRTEHV